MFLDQCVETLIATVSGIDVQDHQTRDRSCHDSHITGGPTPEPILHFAPTGMPALEFQLASGRTFITGAHRDDRPLSLQIVKGSLFNGLCHSKSGLNHQSDQFSLNNCSQGLHGCYGYHEIRIR
jgi:hypothetical protein